MEPAIVRCRTKEDAIELFRILEEHQPINPRYTAEMFTEWCSLGGEKTCIGFTRSGDAYYGNAEWFQQYFEYLDDYRDSQVEQTPPHRRLIELSELLGDAPEEVPIADMGGLV